MEADFWTQFSEGYNNKVFSLTKIPQRRKQILRVLESGRVLNLGCGPTPYLNNSLLNAGNSVVATDFCQSMLDSARKRLVHPNLNYILADSRSLPFKKGVFDSVVSVNSILPPSRDDVRVIAKEVFRVLKDDGVFVTFLPSYDSACDVVKNLGPELNLDSDQMRVWDTTGWQCFHTPESISLEIGIGNYRDFSINRVFLNTLQEIAIIKKIYGVDSSRFPIHEYFFVGRK